MAGLEEHSQKTESKWLAEVKKAFGALGSAIMKVYSKVYSWKGRAMEPEKHEKKWVKHLRRMAWFAAGAIVFFIVALWLAPLVEFRGARIPLSRLQLAYGLLSAIIAVALYVWGVGDWSRFEPPPDSASKPSDSKAAPPVAPGGAAAAVSGAAAGTAPVTPTQPKGAN